MIRNQSNFPDQSEITPHTPTGAHGYNQIPLRAGAAGFSHDSAYGAQPYTNQHPDQSPALIGRSNFFVCSMDINRDSKSRSRDSGRDEMGEGLAKGKTWYPVVGTVKNYRP